MVVVSAGLGFTEVLLAKTFAIGTVITSVSNRKSITAGVADTLNVEAYTVDLVTLLEETCAFAMVVVGAIAGYTFVVDAAFLLATRVVPNAADSFALVAYADLARVSVAVLVGGTGLLDTYIVLAKVLVLAEAVSTAADFFAKVGVLVTDFRNSTVTVGFLSAVDLLTFGVTVLASIDLGAVR